MLESSVIELLERRPSQARFVAEIVAALHEPAQVMERTLANLESKGKIIVREGFCADPHLDGVDLRVRVTTSDKRVEIPFAP